MPDLEVPGATLHYQINGQGPILLTISGANGSFEIWHPLMQHLKNFFTIISYDRRGFSRSYLSGVQDYSHRLERDADDAAALIKHCSPDQPAIVLGSSSGAIVAMKLLLRHPDLIETTIFHEPPAVQLNPDYLELKEGIEAIYTTYRRSGVPPAIEQFCKYAQLDEMESAGFQHSVDPRFGTHVRGNVMYWFERELSYPFVDFKPEMFEKYKAKMVLLCGQMTNKEAFHFRASENLAGALGLRLELVAGAHPGYASHAEEFAEDFMGVLKEKEGA